MEQGPGSNGAGVPRSAIGESQSATHTDIYYYSAPSHHPFYSSKDTSSQLTKMLDPDPPPRLQTFFGSSAQPHQMAVSPKRKRGPSDPALPTQPFAPRLNTSAFPGTVVNTGASDVLSANTEPHSASGVLLAASTESGSESPRSKVAGQFERLQINKGASLPVIDFGSGDAGAVATKKARHSDDPFGQQPQQQAQYAARESNHLSHSHELQPQSPQPVLEIAETPQDAGNAAQLLTPPPPSSSPSVKLLLSTRRPNPKLHRASPSPSVRALATSSSSTTAAGPPRQLPNPTALTWQDSEITGHNIDREHDDDGYGINGIGFRPTHAVAQHRALKRRQQILEWRAREAREARQKRSERRRLGALAQERNVGGEVQKRVVRFA